jgi:hypothetical protein
MQTLFENFTVMKPDLFMDQVPVSPTVYEELDASYGDFRSHVLIAAHRFEQDWPTWEKHPAGDELVVLLSGSVELVLRQGNADRHIQLSEPVGFARVPRDVWHTARISEPTSMLFVTPGEGTLNAESPD